MVPAVDIGALTAALAVVLWFFPPSLLLMDTTMTGLDTGAHIYPPLYLRDHLLPHGLVSGWSNDWFAGFPILHFYFPLVPMIQAVLGYAVPYTIAFKIGTVLGLFLLPTAVYLLLRLLGLPFPTPAVGALLSLGFLFMPTEAVLLGGNFGSSFGGNVGTSIAGQYSFTLSFGLSLIFLGAAFRTIVTRTLPVWIAGCVLALAGLSHAIPVIAMTPGFITVIVFGARAWGTSSALRRAVGIVAIAAGSTAFWSLPFLVRLAESPGIQHNDVRGLRYLVPAELLPVMLMAGAGVALAIVRRDKRLLPIAASGALAVTNFAFPFIPGVWNGRFVPFWYMTIFVLASYFLGSGIPQLVREVRLRRPASYSTALICIPILATAGVTVTSHAPQWHQTIAASYGGYERSPGYPEFSSLMDRLAALPPGRVMWESSVAYRRFGSAHALMSIPYWTDHSSLQGLLYESSVSAPFVGIAGSEVSKQAFLFDADLPYRNLDMRRGVRHMMLMGVDYYISSTGAATRAAKVEPTLELVDRSGRFSIFKLVGRGGIVEIPRYEPVVYSGEWRQGVHQWFGNLGDLAVPLVRTGMRQWETAADLGDPLPRLPTRSTQSPVEATVGPASLSFTTEAVGVPHLVKVSYFPNWQATGAIGPFEASPSFMIVIPTQREVRLTYERTWVEWVGLSVTMITLGLGLGTAATRTISLRRARTRKG